MVDGSTREGRLIETPSILDVSGRVNEIGIVMKRKGTYFTIEFR
jgi:hypothetical protein